MGTVVSSKFGNKRLRRSTASAEEIMAFGEICKPLAPSKT